MRKGTRKVKKVVESFTEKKAMGCEHDWLLGSWERDTKGVAVAIVKQCKVCGEVDRKEV